VEYIPLETRNCSLMMLVVCFVPAGKNMQALASLPVDCLDSTQTGYENRYDIFLISGHSGQKQGAKSTIPDFMK
jgi:hypothetical protein